MARRREPEPCKAMRQIVPMSFVPCQPASAGLLRQSAQHQLIEPARKRRGTLRQLAVENLRLLQQQKRQIAGGVFFFGDGADKRMMQVDLEDRFSCGCSVLLCQ